ncbi:MAG: type II secretion system minor pseudopilin GspI [Rudaea sp.]
MIARADSTRSRGFTLLEVLIGLVVLALALVALSRTAANQVNSFGALRERTFAGWLAQDVLTQSRLSTPFPAPGKTDGRRRFANRDWRYELEVESTDVATIRRLDVRVFQADDRTNPIVNLTGFATSDLQP